MKMLICFTERKRHEPVGSLATILVAFPPPAPPPNRTATVPEPRSPGQTHPIFTGEEEEPTWEDAEWQ